MVDEVLEQNQKLVAVQVPSGPRVFGANLKSRSCWWGDSRRKNAGDSPFVLVLGRGVGIGCPLWERRRDAGAFFTVL